METLDGNIGRLSMGLRRSLKAGESAVVLVERLRESSEDARVSAEASRRRFRGDRQGAGIETRRTDARCVGVPMQVTRRRG